ncbi:MAG: hypothetical protein KDC38_16800, partial [Planctomycetes bacterium]|nr:hypothetical protein [Planctomycetota bacterium]
MDRRRWKLRGRQTTRGSVVAALLLIVLIRVATPAVARAIAQNDPVDAPLPTRVVAIVRDRDSGHFDGLLTGVRAELESLAVPRYRCEFRDDFNAGGDPTRVPVLLREALDSPDIDLIITAGVQATSYAARLPERRVPVVAAAIDFADLEDSLLGASGASALDNFTFVRSPRRISADLELLSQISDAPRLHVLVDERIVESLGDRLKANVERVEHRLDLEIELVPMLEESASVVDRIPGDARGVYVAKLEFDSDDERRALYGGFAAR